MLPDLLKDSLTLVICGTAAGNISAQRQYYYAGPGNQFWRTLFDIQLTPYILQPSEYTKLVTYNIGLTDLAKNVSGMDNSLPSSDFNRDLVRSKILKCQPKYLCFNGKKAAKAFLDRNHVEYGLLSDRIGSTQLYVAPSTSGTARGYWDINIWHQLAQLCKTK